MPTDSALPVTVYCRDDTERERASAALAAVIPGDVRVSGQLESESLASG